VENENINANCGTIGGLGSINCGIIYCYSTPRWNFCPDCGLRLGCDWKFCAGCAKAIPMAGLQYGGPQIYIYPNIYPYGGSYPYFGGNWAYTVGLQQSTETNSVTDAAPAFAATNGPPAGA
jgi:hypothetical protein